MQSSRKSSKMGERKGTKNDLQNTTQKTEDRATWSVLKTGDAQEWYLSINVSAAVSILDLIDGNI
jgi:hypothetical protein